MEHVVRTISDMVVRRDAELATLRAENLKLREALRDICKMRDQECYAVAVAKEALK